MICDLYFDIILEIPFKKLWIKYYDIVNEDHCL